MASQEISVPSRFFVRIGEMKHIGDTEKVELRDDSGNIFLTVELGVLGRDEEMLDGSGALLGKMQDKMHIGEMKGYRYRNLLDSKGRLVGIATPEVPDPRPNERHYVLKDDGEKAIALAVTSTRQSPELVIIGSPDGSKTIARMSKGMGINKKVSQSVIDNTASYTVNMEFNTLPNLLFAEFVVSLFLFVLKA